jgi:hypothetical protein
MANEVAIDVDATIIRRPIHPEVRVIDESQGTVEYVASDETVDSYNELIRAKGWRFTHFEKNAPFVDSHRYDSVEDQLGKVIDFKVSKGRLIETVKWAIDVPDNRLAQLGFAMTKAGYTKAVSVGFWPVKAVSKWDSDLTEYRKEIEKLGLDERDGPKTIYQEQEQIELSAVVIGANPNALARAFKANVLSDSDLDFLSQRSAALDTGIDPSDLPRINSLPRQDLSRIAFYLRVREIAERL